LAAIAKFGLSQYDIEVTQSEQSVVNLPLIYGGSNPMKPVIPIAALLLLLGACADPTPTTSVPDASSAPEAPAPHPDAELIAEAGAPLFDGMGDFSHAITTSHPGAQRYFNQGMVLAFAFNHAESIRSFRAAQRLDPSCAMCFWGEALATGPNINVTSNGQAIMSADDRVSAHKALQQAVALKEGVTEPESAYIDALATRYNGDAQTPRAPLDLAWAKAMGEVAAKYPQDYDAASIYAEALMNTMPWNYWSESGEPRPETEKVIGSLDRVLAAAPRHPLALHLYIHALEASSDPSRAEAAADRLIDLVPAAGHLVHMPAHIFYRVGRYNDAAQANVRAAAVDEAYIAACNAQGFYPALYYPHNIHFLWSSATMQGQRQLSIDSARRVVANVRVEQVKQFPTIEFFRTVPLLSLVRFGEWEAVLAEPAPDVSFKFATAIWHYARGVAQAALGNTAEADAELAALLPLQSDVSVTFLDSMDYPGSLLIGIAIDLLRGEMAYRTGDYGGAVTEFEKAVAAQDTLPYTEPPFWYYPTRQSLGAALLKAGDAEAAEAVYRADLKDYPHNGWSMLGLAQSLTAQGKTQDAAMAQAHFETAWQFADTTIEASIL
jgi:tetratricopeptide (TPR) repeat protein